MTTKNKMLFATIVASVFFAATCSDSENTNNSVDGGNGTDSDNGGDTDSSSDSDSDSDSDSNSEEDEDDDAVCGEVDVSFESQTPTVILLIDHSSSMESNFGNGSRWDVVRNALLADDGIIKELEKEIRFGIQLYTSRNGRENGNECPLLNGIDPTLNSYDSINSFYRGEEPIDDTPTGESIAAVADIITKNNSNYSKVIILATDGEPNTCEDPHNQTDEAKDVAVAAAEDAF